jgi:hypothetical protein
MGRVYIVYLVCVVNSRPIIKIAYYSYHPTNIIYATINHIFGKPVFAIISYLIVLWFHV